MFRAKRSRPVALSGEQGYISSDVSRICGVSLRQLQWWDERKVVSPRQDGHKRIYMTQEVVEISVIAELRRKGFSLQKIRRVLRFLQKDMGRRLSEALSSTSDVHLLTDGKSIYWEEAPNRIIELVKNAKRRRTYRTEASASCVNTSCASLVGPPTICGRKTVTSPFFGSTVPLVPNAPPCPKSTATVCPRPRSW